MDDRLPPLKPQRPALRPDFGVSGKHGTAAAASRSGPMHPHALVVSVHDVSPRTRVACDAILNDLAALGVSQCSLLVVPNHHHEGHICDDADFCEWLQARSAAGHEIVIHGYYHQRERRPEESLGTKVTTRIYTADEGEFFDVDRPTATALVTKARDEFQQVGLAPDGFIAPAWLMNKETEGALKEAGCEYTTTLRSIVDLKTGKRYHSQSLVWSVRSAWRRWMSRVWNAALFRFQGGNSLLRISIHPVDVAHHSIWRQIRRLVAAALRDRAPYTYERWVTRERTFRLATR